MTEFEQRRETVNGVATKLLLDMFELLDLSPADIDLICATSLDDLSAQTMELAQELKSRNGSGADRDKVNDAASFLLFSGMDDLEVVWLTYRTRLALPPGFRAYWMLIGRRNRELPEEERSSSEQVRSNAVNGFKVVPPEDRAVHAALESNIEDGTFGTLPMPRQRPRPRPTRAGAPRPRCSAAPVEPKRTKPEQENIAAVASLIKRTAAAAVASAAAGKAAAAAAVPVAVEERAVAALIRKTAAAAVGTVVAAARERALAEEVKQQRALEAVISLNKDAAQRRAAALRERERLAGVEERREAKKSTKRKPVKESVKRASEPIKEPIKESTTRAAFGAVAAAAAVAQPVANESPREPIKESKRLRKASRAILVRIAAMVIQKATRVFIDRRKLIVQQLLDEMKQTVKTVERCVEVNETPTPSSGRRRRLPALTPCRWGTKCTFGRKCRYLHDEEDFVKSMPSTSQPPSTSTLHDDSRLCCVCLAEEKNTAALACKHLCVCEDCSKTLFECPICRTPSDFLTMFL